MKKNYKVRKPISEKFMNFVERHMKAIVIVFIITVVLIPVACSIHINFQFKFGGLSRAGLLSYLGDAIASIATLFTAMVALCTAQQSSVLQERIFLAESKDRQRSMFSLSLNKRENEVYELTLKNVSDNPAKEIYLYDGTLISQFIDKGKTIKCKITFNKEVSGAINIDNTDCYDLVNGYPKEIVLGFSDLYGNDTQQTFKRESDNYYISSKLEYC